MATSIKVTPDEVVRTARAIDADEVQFKAAYENVYKASEELTGHWAGKDAVEFDKKIQAYKPELIEMDQRIREYVGFLDRSAAEYRETQDDIYGKAGQLPTI